jgi:hypothetical protein
VQLVYGSLSLFRIKMVVELRISWEGFYDTLRIGNRSRVSGVLLAATFRIEEMFVAEFGEEHLGNRLISRRSELDVQQVVRIGIDSSVQPEPFVVDLDHGLVNRNVTRVRTVEGL